MGEALKTHGLVEHAESNVAWFNKYQEVIGTFFDKQKLVTASQDNRPGGSPRISLPTLSFTMFLVLLARFASFIR